MVAQSNLQYNTVHDQMMDSLYKQRILFLAGEIALGMAEIFVKELLYITHLSKDPVKIILNSVGGDVYDGLFIYDMIEELVAQGIEIEIEARGLAASMGCIILQSGSKRVATNHTRFLIHEVTSLSIGTVTEMEEQVQELRNVNNDLRDIIAKRTGHTKEEVDKLWSKKEVWYSAEEALKFGLIDEVID